MAGIEGQLEVAENISFVLAVAFDLDGTLVDLEPLHHAAHLRAAQAVGVSLTWDEAFERLEHFVGGPDERVASEIALLSRNAVSPEAVLRLKRRHFLSLLASSDRIVPRKGIQDVLNCLAARHMPLAVGTVTERALALRILDQAGLLSMFEEQRVVTSDDVAELKPAPDVYLETARRLHVDPRCQLVFEDSPTGVRAARSSGSPCVAVPAFDHPQLLQALADAGVERIFSSWEDASLWRFLEHELRPDKPIEADAERRRGSSA